MSKLVNNITSTSTSSHNSNNNEGGGITITAHIVNQRHQTRGGRGALVSTRIVLSV